MTRSRQTADWGSRAGLAKIVPSSVAVGSGTGSASALGTVSFSGASSVSLNGCFNATYDNYVINFAGESFTGSDNFRMRLRVSGADNTTGNYFSTVRAFSNQQVQLFLGAHGDDKFFVGQFDSNYPSSLNMFINYPFATKKTAYHGTGLCMQGGYQAADHHAGMFLPTTSFDGFTLYPAAGTMTGTITVLGCN